MAVKKQLRQNPAARVSQPGKYRQLLMKEEGKSFAGRWKNTCSARGISVKKAVIFPGKLLTFPLPAGGRQPRSAPQQTPTEKNRKNYRQKPS
jgi:hypothetical protein